MRCSLRRAACSCRYLSFLKGIVDSDTLPLSVSRETLQAHASLKVIKKKIVRKVLDSLKKMSDAEKEGANPGNSLLLTDLILILYPVHTTAQNGQVYRRASLNAVPLLVCLDMVNQGRLSRCKRGWLKSFNRAALSTL